MEADQEFEMEKDAGTRRISKPRTKYSPPIMGKSTKHGFKKHRTSTQQTHFQPSANAVNESPFKSVSPSFSCENSFVDEEDANSITTYDYDSDNGVDEISQTDLREQISQMTRRDFKLPGYFEIPNGTSSHYFPSFDQVYFDSSLDEQEEIKVLKSPLSEIIGGEGMATPINSLNGSNTLNEYTSEPKSQTENSKEKSTTTFIIPPAIVRSKLGIVQSSSIQIQSDDSQLSIEHQKRPRRPPKKSDDFVYTPLVKMTPPVKPIKSISRQTLLKPEGHNRGHLQQNLELQNEKTKEAPITAELKVSKIEKPTPPVNVSLSKETADSRPITPPKMKTITRKRKKIESPLDKQLLPKIKRRPLKLAKLLPLKPITVELAQSITKRLRRPTMRSDDFFYIPVKKEVSTTSVKSSATVTIQPSTSSIEKITPTDAISVANNEELPIKRKRGRPRRIPIEKIDTDSPPIPTPLKITSQEQGGPVDESPISTNNLSPKRPKRRVIVPRRIKESFSTKKPIDIRPKVLKDGAIKKSEPIRHPSPKKERKEKSEKQLQKLELIKRMTLLRQLNPFAIGLKRIIGQYEADYFYREILISQPVQSTTDEEIDVDCVRVSAPGGFDELFVTNPAESCANSVHRLLSRNGALMIIDEQQDADADLLISERINSIGPEMKEYLQLFFKFINEQRLVDSTTQGIAGGLSMFYSLTMKNANRLRESLRLYSKTSQPMIVAVHTWLLKNLNVSYLVSYLNLLRFLKTAGSNLSDYIIKSCKETELNEANNRIGEFLGQKLYEPPLSPTSKLIDTEPIRNVSLVLVYPQIDTKTSKHIIRAHETLFRNLLPLAVCCVEKVELNLDFSNDRPISVEECTWICIRLVRRRVREITRRRPNDHIFLAGWGTTCWLNHKVVSKVNGVSGLLDFAFPTESPCGSRGGVDDQICLTYPTTLFVVGEDAQNVNMKALRRLRKNMIADSGLIVVGSANHNLLVSSTILSIERTSQFVVQKNIMEYTIQFIKQVMTDLGTPKECRQLLKPIKLPNTHEIDPAFFKTTGPTNKPRKPTKLGTKVNESEYNKKGKEQPKIGEVLRKAPLRHPTQIAGQLPPQLRPVIPASSTKYNIALHSARNTFNTSLKNAELREGTTTSDVLKIPSPESLNRQIPPLLHHLATPTTSSAPSHVLQDTLREEEEAAAALASLK